MNFSEKTNKMLETMKINDSMIYGIHFIIGHKFYCTLNLLNESKAKCDEKNWCPSMGKNKNDLVLVEE